MKAYIRHLLAVFATFFGSQASMTPSAIGQDQEAQEWAEAKSAGTLKAFEDYLARNPVGPYSRDAFREIIRLSNGDFGDVPAVDEICKTDPSLVDPALLDDAYCSVAALY